MADESKENKNKIEELSGAIKDFKDGLGDSLSAITDINQAFKELQKNTKGLKGDLDISGYIKGSTDAVKLLKKEYSTINGIIDKTLEGKAKSNDLTKLEESTTNAIKSLGEQIKSNKSKQLQLQKEIAGKSKEEGLAIQSQIEALNEVNETLANEQTQLEKNKEVAKELQGEFDRQSKAIGPAGVILEEMGENIKSLNKFTGEAAEKMRKYAAANKDSHTFIGQIKTSMVGVTALVGAAAQHAMSFQAILGFIVHSALHADKTLTSISKNQGVSTEQARQIEHHYVNIAANSEYSSVNISRLVEAQSQLAEVTGVTAGYTDEMLEQQVVLTTQMGLSATEAAKINNMSMMNNKSTQETKVGIANQVVNLEKQTGIRLNYKKVMQDVSKIQGQLSAQYKNDPLLIAKAVIQAQKMGITLEQAANMGKQLLNWEQSIEAELEAELLTGKQLNLNEARNLALRGKSAEAATLLLKQVGSAKEFSDMDLIQQEAIAKSMGMQTDELANSLREKELLQKLGAKNMEELAAQEGGLERMRAAGGEDLVAAYEKQSAQEKLNEAMVKMSEILSALVGGPLAQFLGFMANILSNAGALYTILGAIGILMGGKMLMSLGRVVAQLGAAVGLSTAKAVAEMTAASALTLGLGTIGIVAAAAAGAAGIYALVSKAKDMKDGVMAPDGKVLYSGKEGAIKLNDKDTVIAGTDLGGGKGAGEKPAAAAAGGGGGANINLSPLIAKMDQLIGLLQAGSKVTLDGKEVGKALGLNSVNANMA